MNSTITFSILNLIANLIIFIGGFIFYYHFLTHQKIKIKEIYYIMRVLTALLLTGSFARVIFDFNIIYIGENKHFNIIEYVISLCRNIGLGGILIYLTNKFKNTKCEF